MRWGRSMALRYDDRGSSSMTRPYYNGKGGGGGNETGGGRGRIGRFAAADDAQQNRHKKYERKEVASGSRNCDGFDDRSVAGDSDKGQSRRVGDWTEQWSKGGKKYYYNCRTEVSQWEKPAEWVAWEKSSGVQEHSRKRRHAADETTSPSHSSAGQPPAQYRKGEDGRGSSRRDYGRRGHPSRHEEYSSSRSKYSSSKYNNNNDHRQHDQSAPNCSSAVAGGRRKRPSPDDQLDGQEAKQQPAGLSNDRDGAEKSKDSDHEHDDEAGSSGQVDMERLPHLLVEIAEKNSIDLSDPDALEKIKRHLKTALCHELSNSEGPSSRREEAECPLTAVSDEEDDDQQQVCCTEPTPTTGADGGQEPVVSRAELSSQFNETLTAHVRGWNAQHFEAQATQLSNVSFRMSLDVSHISADLKCARSLVRTAEIRSTLLEQRTAYLRHQYHELETMSKPGAASAS